MAEKEMTVQDALLRALQNLDQRDFQRFKELLSEWKNKEGFINITKDQLEGADPSHVTDLIRRHYGDGAEVTLAVLRAINERKVREDLHHDKMKAGANFMDKHREDLIRKIEVVDPVLRVLWKHGLLTQEQYNELRKKTANKEKMRGLCDLIRHWDDVSKSVVCKALRRYNSAIILDLERNEQWKERHRPVYPSREKFLEKHRLDLISKINMIDPVLDDLLDQGLLEQKQHDHLKQEISAKKKMTALLAVASDWSENSKQIFYTSLETHNYTIIKDLIRVDTQATTEPTSLKKHPKCHVPWSIDMSTEQPQLQSGDFSIMANSIFHLRQSSQPLYNHRDPFANERRNFSAPMPPPEFNTPGSVSWIKKQPFAKSVVKKASWDGVNKASWDDAMPTSERSKQQSISSFQQLDSWNAKHFVNKHSWDLIRRIIMVDPVLDDLFNQRLLTEEQYKNLCSMDTSLKKMIELCDFVSSWDDTRKDHVYLSLRQHNLPFIRVLERSDLMLRLDNSKRGSQFHKLNLDLETGSSAGEHFLDKHRSDLISKISKVNPVLRDLQEQGLLMLGQYNDVLLKETPKEKMTQLYDIADYLDNTNKDKVYLSLRRNNYQIIREMEISDQQLRSEPGTSDGEISSYKDSMYQQENLENEWVAPPSLRYTITCAVCWDLFNDPVTLICGHNFCKGCIEKTWDKQDKGDSSCPICRRRFRYRPELRRNPVLHQVVEFCQLTSSTQKTSGLCTYCIQSSAAAAKVCLLCDAFLCEEHLNVHSKLPEHVLLEPTMCLQRRKCSVHYRILEYYCYEDAVCVCASCCVMGGHRGHRVEPVNEAAEKKKDNLRCAQEKLILKKFKIMKSIEVCRREELGDVSGQGHDEDTVRKLLILDQDVLCDISMQEDQPSVSHLIQQLEVKMDRHGHDIDHIEELCNTTDLVLVLEDHRRFM